MPAVGTAPLRNAWSMKVLVASGLGFLIDDDGVEFGSALGVDEAHRSSSISSYAETRSTKSKITSFLLRNVGLESTAAELGRDAQELCTGLAGSPFRRRAPRHEPTGQLHPARWAARGR